ncbi:hypothetical protein Tco_0141738, partial [Tanacetum coccineum]
DKGKGVLEEEPKPVKVKSKDQASLNYIANLYDEVQERIDDDHELAIRWTQEEQEKYIVDERAKLLAEYFENRKKSEEDERLIKKMNKKVEGVYEEKVLEEPDNTKVEDK